MPKGALYVSRKCWRQEGRAVPRHIWKVRFTMPSVYSLTDLSEPSDPRVHPKSVPPTRMAALNFLALQLKVASNKRPKDFRRCAALQLDGNEHPHSFAIRSILDAVVHAPQRTSGLAPA